MSPLSKTKQVTIREPKDMPKRVAKKLPNDPFKEETIYMDPNGILSSDSNEYSESVHSVPSSKEMQQCLKESCNKKKDRHHNKKKKSRSNTVTFTDTEMPKMPKKPIITGLPEKTNVKQIAQSLGHLMDMMSRARMAKVPKISMTIKPRKTNLSQDSDVTAVDALSEAGRRRTTPRGDTMATGKLLGGNAVVGHRSISIPRTPSNMKLNRAKSFDSVTSKRLSGVVKQIRCGPTVDALNKSHRLSEATGLPMKVDQRTTNDIILEYLKNRGSKNLKTPSSIMKGSRSKSTR